eukprot:361381-Chlamydomonas_euryale.AAC.4
MVRQRCASVWLPAATRRRRVPRVACNTPAAGPICRRHTFLSAWYTHIVAGQAYKEGRNRWQVRHALRCVAA